MRPIVLSIVWLGTALLACGAGAAESVLSVGSDLSRLPAAERTAQVRGMHQSTRVAWAEGRMVLADAIALLEASGNPTALAPGTDGTRQATVPAVAGDYWHALLTVCSAFDLDLLPGSVSGMDGSQASNRSDRGQVALQGGPVLLAPRSDRADTAKARRSSCGPLLVELVDIAVNRRQGGDEKRWIEALVRLRLEPRIALNVVGGARLAWTRVEAEAGSACEFERQDDAAGGDVSRVRLSCSEGDPRSLRLTGALELDVLEPLRVSCRMLPGDSMTVDLGEHKLALRLLDDEQAKGEGKQRSGVLLTYPTAALAREPQVELLIGGKALSCGGMSSQGGGLSSERMLYFSDLVEAEHEVALGLALPLAEVAMPVRLDVDLVGLPADEAPGSGFAPETPTRIVWPDGTISLQEAIRLLNVNGNTAIVDLGIDDRERRAVTAFTGSFWEAALALCERFDLEILPPAAGKPPDRNPRVSTFSRIRPQFGQNAALGCGPLRLGRPAGGKQARAFQACGPILVEILPPGITTTRNLSGVSRQAEASLRLRIEPRVDESLVSEPTVFWSTFADNQAGANLAVSRLPVPGNAASQQAMLEALGENDRPALLKVAVAGLPAGLARFTIHGQLLFQLRRPARAEARLQPGEQSRIQLGATSAVVALVLNDGSERSGVRLGARAGQLEDLQVAVRSPTGQVLHGGSRSSRRFGDREEVTFYFEGIEHGKHTVAVSSRETLAQPCLPLNVEVALP